MSDLDELKEELEKLESENIGLYQETKRIFGWPLCGERPPCPDCFTKQEFEDDASRTMEIFLVFVRDLNARIKRANITVKKKFNLYEGEKPVAIKDVVVGKPMGDMFKIKRELDL